ncbi:ABC transporter permease [Nakamurella leprariae]|uniref:ABC transporter permease n=1 Tax=Nakamurella leprariae TaxID=2803911 RepID=A0A938YH90_9ACTN|nr:ABC transporter permease [Nakamurella leprariae]MBM9468322.1 ABC transporter permease [Nakamurella leprariae]
MIRAVWQLRLGRICIVVLTLIALLGILGPMLAPYGPNDQDVAVMLQGPSAAHWLGTDDLGRDVLSRLLAGSTLSLVAALEAVGIGLVLGVLPGLLSMVFGRIFEWVSLRVMDALITLPFMVFAVAMTALLGNGLHQAMFAVGLLVAPAFYRITRAAAMTVIGSSFVEAARLTGLSELAVIRRHVWPKVAPAIAVTTASMLGTGLVVVSSLTFLGIGIVPPEPTWGGMMATDLNFLYQKPWGPLVPAALIIITVAALSGLADALRDATGQSGRSLISARRAKQARAKAARNAGGPVAPAGRPDDRSTVDA